MQHKLSIKMIAAVMILFVALAIVPMTVNADPNPPLPPWGPDPIPPPSPMDPGSGLWQWMQSFSIFP